MPDVLTIHAVAVDEPTDRTNHLLDRDFDA
jgi:hypothetical protein